MPAEPIRVTSPSLLVSADSAARVLEEAAKPLDEIQPTGGGGSASDLAGAAVAAAMSARASELAAAVAGAGPAVQMTTTAGVARLQAQDHQNADAIRTVAQQESQWV